MKIEKATIIDWSKGITTSTRAYSVEELNSGFSMIKNFDINSDPQKAKPVPELVRWNTQDEEIYQFKGLGASGDTYFATGYARKNWYGDAWGYRVKVTPQYVDTGFVLYNLENMPATFWSNVNTSGSDIRVIDQNGVYVAVDVISIDVDAETGWIAFPVSTSGIYYYIYYGNPNATFPTSINTSIDRSNTYSDVNYIYQFIEGDTYPKDRTQTIGDTRTLDTGSISAYGSAIPNFITDGLASPIDGGVYQNTDNKPNFPDSEELTLSFLLHFTALPASNTIIIDDGNFGAVNLRLNTTGTVTLLFDTTGSADATITSTTVLSTNTTYRISIVFSKDNFMELFINGVLEGSNTTNVSGALDDDSSYIQFRVPTSTFIDMVSYSSIVSNKDQLLHEYQMYFDNANYFTTSTEESKPSFIEIDTNSIALYKKALTDSSWSEIVDINPAKSFTHTPQVAPVYATSVLGIKSFFGQREEQTSFLSLIQSTTDTANPLTVVNSSQFSTPINAIITYEEFVDSKQYFTDSRSSVHSLNLNTLDTDVFTAQSTIQDIQAYNGYLALGGYRTNTNTSFLQIWDGSSSASTQYVDMGLGQLRVLGNINGNLFSVINNFLDDSDKSLGMQSMDIRFYGGGNTTKTTHTISVPATLENYYQNSWEQPVSQLKGKTKNAVIFYAKLPTEETGVYNEGMWAVGLNEVTETLSLSMLYDTSSLGDVYNVSTLANQCVFLHDDGKVSHVNPNPLYTNESIVVTKTFNAGNSETTKKLHGVEVMHENLQEGQSISVYRKTESDTDYVLLLTSNTAGATSKESTNKPQSNSMGDFKEVTFKIVSTGGNACLKQFAFTYENLMTKV